MSDPLKPQFDAMCEEQREFYGAEVYARAKRQLSSRERSRLGLWSA